MAAPLTSIITADGYYVITADDAYVVYAGKVEMPAIGTVYSKAWLRRVSSCSTDIFPDKDHCHLFQTAICSSSVPDVTHTSKVSINSTYSSVVSLA